MTSDSTKLAASALWFLASVMSIGCRSTPPTPPKISFTKVPEFGVGNASQLNPIEGAVEGAHREEHVVLYAKSGDWWVQPLRNKALTAIQGDSSWKNRTHPGSNYAALLVKADYVPRLRTAELPSVGGSVLAVATVREQVASSPLGKSIVFAGYDWQVRDTENDAGGTRNFYRPENVWLETDGSLHLRLAASISRWTSAAVNLRRSLGYGTYRFVVRDLSRMELAAAFAMTTWSSRHTAHEMDIEVSKWGETFTRNAQFVIQPYHLAANTIQFDLPPGKVTFMLRWAPGRAAFKAFRGAKADWEQPSIREHVFTSGVPVAGEETLNLNLYVFGNRTSPIQRGTEVAVEAFDYLP